MNPPIRPGHRTPEGGLDGRSAPDPTLPSVKLPAGLPLRLHSQQGDWAEVSEPGGNRYWVDARLLVVDASPITRRPNGWYAQAYRRAYGEQVSGTRDSLPAGAGIGVVLVVLGLFTPWLRPAGQWLSAATAMDVPLRSVWNGNPSPGTDPLHDFWNSVTGLSVGLFTVVFAVLAVVALLGFLPGWVKTTSAIIVVVLPTLVLTQISRAISQQSQFGGPRLWSVVGPGMVFVAAGGAVLGLTRRARALGTSGGTQ